MFAFWFIQIAAWVMLPILQEVTPTSWKNQKNKDTQKFKQKIKKENVSAKIKNTTFPIIVATLNSVHFNKRIPRYRRIM